MSDDATSRQAWFDVIRARGLASRGIASLLLAFGVGLAPHSAFGAAMAAALFEGENTLLKPRGYREWIFVGSSVGLRYDEPGEKTATDNLEFKNVYINPPAYRRYQRTGKFPQGTILILETATNETKQEPGLAGSYQKDFSGLLAAVKDRRRFREGWAYFRFSGGDGKLQDKARPFPKSACYDCHREKAAHDNVFTQFYPVLRAPSGKVAP